MMKTPKVEKPLPPANAAVQASYASSGTSGQGRKRPGFAKPAPITGSSVTNAGRPSLLGGS